MPWGGHESSGSSHEAAGAPAMCTTSFTFSSSSSFLLCCAVSVTIEPGFTIARTDLGQGPAVGVLTGRGGFDWPLSCFLSHSSLLTHVAHHPRKV